MSLDIKYFREKLEKELQTVEKELSSVGRHNPDNLVDWEAVPPEKEDSEADPNIAADTIEDYEINTAIVKELEEKWNNIKKALNRIKDGTYGKCKIGGEEIETERLEANPSAQTCKLHMEK